MTPALLVLSVALLTAGILGPRYGSPALSESLRVAGVALLVIAVILLKR
jgi:hypothetical protein